MRTHRIALIPGDGIGPEVVDIGRQILLDISKFFNFKLETQTFSLGARHYLNTGETLSDKTLEELKKFDAIFFRSRGPRRRSNQGFLSKESC